MTQRALAALVPMAADVAYYKHAPDAYAAERCRLDVYTPAAKGFPTIVFFHGGGLTDGSRHDATDFVRRMLDEGVGVVLVDYRLSPRAKSPAYIEDAAASVTWTLDHITRHGGDPKRVHVSGHSAGGYLALMVSLDAKYLAALGHAPADLAGAIPIAGQTITHHTVRAERGIPREQPVVDDMAPLHHVRQPGPPMLCIAGGEDMPARAEENAYFVAARRAFAPARADLLIVPGRTHTSILEHLHTPTDPVAQAIIKVAGTLRVP